MPRYLHSLPPPVFWYACLPYMNPFSIYIFATYLQVVNLYKSIFSSNVREA